MILIPQLPHISHGAWHMVSTQKMLVELNSQLNTSYSLQIPEGQVGGHLHLLPEKLCLQEKERGATSQQRYCPRTYDALDPVLPLHPVGPASLLLSQMPTAETHREREREREREEMGQ